MPQMFSIFTPRGGGCFPEIAWGNCPPLLVVHGGASPCVSHRRARPKPSTLASSTASESAIHAAHAVSTRNDLEMAISNHGHGSLGGTTVILGMIQVWASTDRLKPDTRRISKISFRLRASQELEKMQRQREGNRLSQTRYVVHGISAHMNPLKVNAASREHHAASRYEIGKPPLKLGYDNQAG